MLYFKYNPIDYTSIQINFKLTHVRQFLWTSLVRRVSEVFWKIHCCLSNTVTRIVSFRIILKRGNDLCKMQVIRRFCITLSHRWKCWLCKYKIPCSMIKKHSTTITVIHLKYLCYNHDIFPVKMNWQTFTLWPFLQSLKSWMWF